MWELHGWCVFKVICMNASSWLGHVEGWSRWNGEFSARSGGICQKGRRQQIGVGSSEMIWKKPGNGQQKFHNSTQPRQIISEGLCVYVCVLSWYPIRPWVFFFKSSGWWVPTSSFLKNHYHWHLPKGSSPLFLKSLDTTLAVWRHARAIRNS